MNIRSSWNPLTNQKTLTLCLAHLNSDPGHSETARRTSVSPCTACLNGGYKLAKHPPLRSLTVFEAAARNGSFWRAANELHITKSGVSHHIKALEAFLGTKLFVRLNRGVRLTVEGATFYESVHEAYRHIYDGTQQLLRSPQRETLTLRCGASFGFRWLTPRLPLFLAENPEIDLRIVTPTAKQVLPIDSVDIEIRYGPSHQPGMYA